MSKPGRPRRHPLAPTERLALHMKAAETAFVLDALRRHNGHISRTAEYLEIHRRTLGLLLLRLGIEGEAAGMRTAAGISGKRQPTRATAPMERGR